MRQRITLYFLLIICSTSLYSQIPPSAYIQHVSPSTILKNRIDTLQGYVFEYKEGALEKDSVLQTVEVFDEMGRLVVNETHMEFSDIGVLKRTYLYDTLGHVVELKEYESDSLVRAEIYAYNEEDNMTFWKVTFYKNKRFSFDKHMKYDSLNNLKEVEIKMNRRTVKRDSYKNVYNEQGQLLLTTTYDMNKKVLDSTRYTYNQGDTLWLEQYYLKGKPETFKLKTEEEGKIILRTENYNEGTLLEINYHEYDKNFNLQADRSIHTYRRMNYKKNYFYAKSGALSYKKVYHLEKEPEHVVKYYFTQYEKR